MAKSYTTPDTEKRIIKEATNCINNPHELSRLLTEIKNYDLTGEAQVALIEISHQFFYSLHSYKKELYECIFSRNFLAKCNPHFLNVIVENLVCRNEFVSSEKINDYLKHYFESSPYSGILLVKSGGIKRSFFFNFINVYLESKLDGILEIADAKLYFRTKQNSVFLNNKTFLDIKIKVLKKFMRTFNLDVLKTAILNMPQFMKYKDHSISNNILKIFQQPDFLKTFLTKNYEYFSNKKNLSSFKTCYYNYNDRLFTSEKVDKVMEEIAKNIKTPKIWLKY